jgi:hypothetical protein
MADIELTPGSPTTRAKGCICPSQDVGDAFAVKNDCPVHGLDALAAELDKLTPE